MFNNYTGEAEYECCNVVVESTHNQGALLIGDFNSATDPQVHQQYNIKTIITAAAGLQHLEIPNTITQIIYPLKDAKTENIRHYFHQSYLTINQKLKEGGVLVHCAAGVSRSATLVIAYLMKNDQLNFRSAIQRVKKCRSGICPNLGFQLQLKQYQKELNGYDLTMKKNVSERLSETHNFSEDITPIRNKKLQNYSLFSFQPVHNFKSIQPKKSDPKKTATKGFIYSKPKQKVGVKVADNELFISGVAKRPSSQVKQDTASQKRSKKQMMETWGMSVQKVKKI